MDTWTGSDKGTILPPLPLPSKHEDVVPVRIFGQSFPIINDDSNESTRPRPNGIRPLRKDKTKRASGDFVKN